MPLVPPAPVTLIATPALWQEKGWTKGTEHGTVVYEGYYQITDRRSRRTRTFHGMVKMEQGVARPYIADPPIEVFTKHVKAPCFREWHKP
ncbi:MAG TPA: hypothetical protein VEL76_23510 [Gemmataceae bacterium]|nr:hypothetical protein [Gemmataceae bacterium]